MHQAAVAEMGFCKMVHGATTMRFGLMWVISRSKDGLTASSFHGSACA